MQVLLHRQRPELCRLRIRRISLQMEPMAYWPHLQMVKHHLPVVYFAVSTVIVVVDSDYLRVMWYHLFAK